MTKKSSIYRYIYAFICIYKTKGGIGLKKICAFVTLFLTAALVLSASAKNGLRSAFCGNVGFDDLSRSLEVSISKNPVAAMVFGMNEGEATEVFKVNEGQNEF